MSSVFRGLTPGWPAVDRTLAPAPGGRRPPRRDSAPPARASLRRPGLVLGPSTEYPAGPRAGGGRRRGAGGPYGWLVVPAAGALGGAVTVELGVGGVAGR
eukprot:766778-Hanusia_phi.AAC.7